MKLAIKGHPTRGKEVIELLEMLGGENFHKYDGSVENACYFIDNGIVNLDFIREDVCLYILKQFEQKYPYKVGEKVLYLNGRKEWVEGIIDK